MAIDGAPTSSERKPELVNQKHTVLSISPRRSSSPSRSSSSLGPWSQRRSRLAKLPLTDLHPTTVNRDENQQLGCHASAQALASTHETSPPAAVPVLQRRRRLTLPDEREVLSGLSVAVQRERVLDPTLRSAHVSEREADILPRVSAASTGPTSTPPLRRNVVIERDGGEACRVSSGRADAPLEELPRLHRADARERGSGADRGGRGGRLHPYGRAISVRVSWRTRRIRAGRVHSSPQG